MLWYISNALIFVQTVAFLFFNMKSKINKLAAFFVIFVPFAGWSLSQKVFSVNPIIHVMISWMIFVLLAWFLFDEAVKTKAFVIVLDIAVSYASSIITVVVLEMLFADVQTTTLPMLLFYNTLNILLLTVFTMIRKKITISNYGLGIFIAMATIQLLFAEVAILFLVYGKDMNLPEIPFLKSETDPFVLLVIVVACLFYV
ncbi:MAG: hypothetical protein IJB86_01585, partial [Clostridia bacterium]|nr:hypothetical protein [Clostridia bacterium]